MVMKVLTPGVEHGDDADLRAQMPGVCCDGAQCLGGCLEQDVVDLGLVLERNLGDRRRHGEDDMEILDRQQFALTRGEPLRPGRPLALWTMPVAAGVIGVPDQPARGAGLGMAAEFRRPAQLDGAYHPPLDAAKMIRFGRTIGVAVATEDVRHLQSR